MGWERCLGVHDGGDVLSARGTGLGVRDGHCTVVLDKSLNVSLSVITCQMTGVIITIIIRAIVIILILF